MKRDLPEIHIQRYDNARRGFGEFQDRDVRSSHNGYSCPKDVVSAYAERLDKGPWEVLVSEQAHLRCRRPGIPGVTVAEVAGRCSGRDSAEFAGFNPGL